VGNPAYNMPASVRLRGRLDSGALAWSLNAIVARHEALRTTFATVDGRPVQVIAPALRLGLPVVDLRALSAGERELVARRLAGEQARHLFDLARGPLIDAVLLRLDEMDHVLFVTIYHIVADGWSIGVFVRELAALYTAAVTGDRGEVTSPLPPLPIQYADYAVWQRAYIQGAVLDEHLAYWRPQLADLPLLELPTDHPRPAVLSFRGIRRPVLLSPSLAEALMELSRREGVTLFMTLLAAWQVVLARYSGQNDIVVGSPIANRTYAEIEPLIGVFVNNLVLRTDLAGNPTVHELLRRVRRMTLDAYAYQDLPFEWLVDELEVQRDLSRNPLFQVVFVLQNTPMPDVELPGLTVDILDAESGTAKFDLWLSLQEGPAGLNGVLEYSTELFDAATIERLLGHLQTLLAAIVARPQARIAELPLLTEAERRQLLVEWNADQPGARRQEPGARSDVGDGWCIYQLFEEQVARTPDAIALVFDEPPTTDRRPPIDTPSLHHSVTLHITYHELNRRANQLARHLQTLGAGPEVRVAICVERSLALVVGLLGILKAGGAYLPLDPEYPSERLAAMLADSQAPLLLTQADLAERLPMYWGPVTCLDTDWDVIAQECDENPASGACAENLAYIMYTSGSTGAPKGVSVSHRNVVRLVKETNYISLTPADVLLHFAPISFDASTFELWGSLLNGAQLVIFPAHLPSLDELGQVIERSGVTTLWLTSGLFHHVVEGQLHRLGRVRQLLTGGDIVAVGDAQKVLSQLTACRLINGYGPTENTTFTCCYPMMNPAQVGTTVSIGRPIANTQVYVLDHYLQPVPVGVYGELYASGAGVARGYLNRPDLTAEKFVPNPFAGDTQTRRHADTQTPQSAIGNRQSAIDYRLYKTGDLVRYRRDGNIEFLGRIDQQVKIRGFRIEPGEIEAILEQHPAVQACAVLAWAGTPTDKRLVAYVVPAETPNAERRTIHGPEWSSSASSVQRSALGADLRAFLKEKLPHYMLPADFILLEEFPLTPNGKVDRHALPAPDQARPAMEEPFVAPRTPVEQLLANIWSRVLRRDLVGIHDNFFALGGDSIRSI
jgi:aspartate racemase